MRKIILLLIVALLGACHTNQKKQNEQTAGHVKSISLENGNMVVTFEACPDSSIDMQAWQEHYNKYPERWEVAFDYLSGIDPDSLPLGRTDLSDEVFVAVSEYTTKNRPMSVTRHIASILIYNMWPLEVNILEFREIQHNSPVYNLIPNLTMWRSIPEREN